MARRNTQGRSGRRTTSAPRSDSRKKSENRSSGTSGKPGRRSRDEKPTEPSRKSGSYSGRRFTDKKSDKPFAKSKEDSPPKKNFSSPSPQGGKRYNKLDSPPSKGKRPYKKFDRSGPREGSSSKREEFKSKPSTGLRRERPYEKPTDETPSTPRKNYGAPRTKFAERKSGGFRKADDARGKRVDIAAPIQTDKIRLNKFISNSGVCSRREADELIKMGLISVNGKTITELGYKVNPGDEVRYESKILKAEKPVYILLNKPKGFLTTTKDPQERNTVMHLIANAVKERVYPVGRLDRNTTGLLLLTNDGELAEKLMHPSYNVKKIYKVELDRPLTKADAQQILEGVQLEEGKAIVDDLAIISDDKRTVGIEIHIGWNRVVRRIFEALNYDVVKLDRSVYAGLDKKDLGRGEWRFLTREELVRLKHYQ
jgi:23S rRNA pseudouridine2605 synthase